MDADQSEGRADTDCFETPPEGPPPDAGQTYDLSLYVGVPTYGKPSDIFAIQSGWNLMYHIGRNHPEIKRVGVQEDTRTYRQEARKNIVEEAIKGGFTHVLMLDDDHAFTGMDFSKLWWAMLEDPFNRTMLGALYFTRQEHCAPCIFRNTNEGTVPYYYYPRNKLVPVDVIGFGFQLFQTSIFHRMVPPWFSLGLGIGEDAAFCMRVQAAGGKVWCHTGVQVGHVMDTPKIIREADYLYLRDQVERLSNEHLSSYSLMPAGREQVDPASSRSEVRSRPWWHPRSTHKWFGGA
jgi:hypothetical protein